MIAAYRESIDGLGWMTDPTKQRAREKLGKYTLKIGYPEKWRDYSKLQISESDALGTSCAPDASNTSARLRGWASRSIGPNGK